MTLPEAIGRRKRSFCSSVPASQIGLHPRLVCALTMIPTLPLARESSSTVIA